MAEAVVVVVGQRKIRLLRPGVVVEVEAGAEARTED
jgi:hypothetical protein